MTVRVSPRLLACMFLLAYVSTAVALAARAQAAETSFRGTATLFSNPERGFWRFVAEDFTSVTAGELNEVRAAGMTMVYGVVRLDSFRARPLTQELLTRLSVAFARARRAGVKVILRFAYNYPESETEYENARDAALPVVLDHIGQLAPVVGANADIIAIWQAGFIGAWGEGHTSSNGLDRPGPKRTIRDALLDALPPGRQLQWRYPADLIAWSPIPGADGVYPRIGFHNDCFMSSPTDVGTYDEDAETRARQRAYAARLTRTTLFAGETCDIPEEVARTSCAAILDEGAAFHLTTLNLDYARKFHNRWIRDGCFAEVTRRMGYRLQLTSAAIAATGRRGGTVSASVHMRNVGWARPANRRPLQLVLRHAGSGKAYRVASGDLRNADPQDARPRRFAFAWNVPADAPAGRYGVAIAAPDPAARLAARAVYAVRFANADDAGRNQRWDAQRAVYETGLSITVSP